MQHQVAPSTITTALVSAVLEWFLIFLLFIDASFSYLITKFARCSRLQIPCILCSRIDHILDNKKPGFCWDLLCKNHKVKISSLVLCSIHQSLVDVHELCESCLFSFATVNKSNAETYRLLVGKLGDEPHRGRPDLNDGPSSTSRRWCSCCNEQFELVSGSNGHKLFNNMSIKYEGTELYKPLLAIDRQDLVELKDITDVSSSQNVRTLSGKDDDELLPHVGYQKVNISSDTESKASLSDDDSAFGERDLNAADDAEKLPLIDDLTSEKSMHPAVVIDSSLLESRVQVKNNYLHCTESPEPILEELNFPQVEHMSGSFQHAEVSQIISVSDDTLPSSNAGQYSVDVSERPGYQKVNISSDTESKASLSDDDSAFGERDLNAADDTEKLPLIDDLTSEKSMHPVVVIDSSLLESKVQVKNNYLHCTESPEPILEELNRPHVEPLSGSFQHAEVSQIISVSDTLPFSNAGQYSVDVSERPADVKHVAEQGKEAVRNGDTMAVSKITSTDEKLLVLKSFSSDSTSQMPNVLELGDAYKLAVGSRGRQLSGKLLEQISLKDPARVSDDLKLLLSQLSFVRGNGLSSSDVSPRISVNVAEYRSSDASNYTGIQILQKMRSLERNVSGISSLDESAISEIEGECLVDRLKRQVEHDKKIMNSLYKELEEERNASTVAVNQAMAMITRLQEEKSALQMEALQCLRMMEEQAEYDNEDLQKANDLLAEKEKETLDLEAELELYKKKLSEPCLTDNETGKKITMDLQEKEEATSMQSNANVDKLDGFRE